MKTQLIRLTLLEGDAEGLRSAGLAGRTTILMGCSWSNQKTLFDRAEAKRPAVYFMVGSPLDGDTLSNEVIYIGECDSLASRFEQHHMQEAADWRQIFVATTTESTFNKAHARLAEHLLVERAKAAGRSEVLTKVTSKGTVDEGDDAFTREFVENVVTLAQTMGIVIFRPSLKIFSQQANLDQNISAGQHANQIDVPPKFRFDYTQTEIPATMITDGKDFVIQKGSMARADGSAIPPNVKQMREAARKEGILVKQANNPYEVFTQDFLTTSISAAGAMIYGSPCRGPEAWRHEKTGQTYSKWIVEKTRHLIRSSTPASPAPAGSCCAGTPD